MIKKKRKCVHSRTSIEKEVPKYMNNICKVPITEKGNKQRKNKLNRFSGQECALEIYKKCQLFKEILSCHVACFRPDSPPVVSGDVHADVIAVVLFSLLRALNSMQRLISLLSYKITDVSRVSLKKIQR